MPQFFGYITTALSGVLTIVTLFLQVTDIFQEHREARKAALYISLGLFIGNILGMMKSINIELSLKSYSPITVVFTLLFAIVALAALAAALLGLGRKESQSRQESYGLAAIFGFVCFLLLLAIAISHGSIPSGYSINEQLAAARYDFSHGEISRGIAVLQDASSSREPSNPMKAKIDQFIVNA